MKKILRGEKASQVSSLYSCFLRGPAEAYEACMQ